MRINIYILVLLNLVSCSKVFTQKSPKYSQREDYNVYNNLIIGFFEKDINKGKNVFVIQDSTIKGEIAVDPKIRKELPDSVSRMMYLQIINSNKKKAELSKEQFDEKIKMFMLNELPKDSESNMDLFWENIYKNQPMFVALIGLSKVIYDPNNKYALVTMEYGKGKLDGGKIAFVMKKNENGWTILSKVTVSAW